MSVTELTRRGFLVATSLAGGGLALGVSLREARAAPTDAAGAGFAPDVWIRIERDGRIGFVIDRAEIGQGVTTALAQLLAEELEVDPKDVEISFADADHMQMVGSSSSVRDSWEPLRRAGAAAREMLVRAAAERWEVHDAKCLRSKGACCTNPVGEAPRTGSSRPRRPPIGFQTSRS